MIRYSPSTGGFYHLGMHATIPADAVEITGQKHRKLLAEQAAGATIVPHPRTGQPLTVKHPAASLDQRRERARRRIRKQVELRMGAAPWPAMLHAMFLLVSEGRQLDPEARAAFDRLAALEQAAARADKAMSRLKDPDNFVAGDGKHWPPAGEATR